MSEKQKKVTKDLQSKNQVARVFSGEVLTSNFFTGHIPEMLIALVLMLVYIANGYHARFLFQQNQRLEKEVKELRAEYVSSQKLLINKMKYINIQDQIQKKGLGLKELKNPAYTISAADVE